MRRSLQNAAIPTSIEGLRQQMAEQRKMRHVVVFYSHTLYKVTALLTQMTKRKGTLDKERNTQIYSDMDNVIKNEIVGVNSI